MLVHMSVLQCRRRARVCLRAVYVYACRAVSVPCLPEQGVVKGQRSRDILESVELRQGS